MIKCMPFWVGLAYLVVLPVYAEMSVLSIDPSSGSAGGSASASIRITVHIPVRATLKLSSDPSQIATETNLRNRQSLVLSCNDPQGKPLAHCSANQSEQIYTLTTL